MRYLLGALSCLGAGLRRSHRTQVMRGRDDSRGSRADVVSKKAYRLAGLVVALGITVASGCAASVPVAQLGRPPCALDGQRDVSSVLMGVNLASANFGKQYSDWPGTYGVQYVYPAPAELDYYQRKGLTLIRLPFSWQRMQPTPDGPLDAAQVAHMQAFLDAARKRGLHVVLDAHDFGRYHPFDDSTVIGSAKVPIPAFQDFWTKMAAQFGNDPAVYGFDIMNEPHDMGGARVWPAAAQAAVNGIRTVDKTTPIMVEGDNWANAATWQTYNGDLNIDDPSHEIVYEAHEYFDANGSGNYVQTYDQSGAYPNIGVDRLQPFVDWLNQQHARGYLGEYGVPRNDPRWLTVLDNFLASLKADGLIGTYWAGGPWWGPTDPLSVEPINGQNKPQMTVLEKYRACVAE